ncbi:MAG: YchJ family protein [Chitinivibrionales bacterium]|nr:YchJ family protein [Chitinivibrionales bacterium]
MENCPCGSNKTYDECCKQIIHGEQNGDTAEQVMRARYSAYVQGKIQFIVDSIHPKEKQNFDEQAIRRWSEKSQWLGLEIKSTEKGGPKDTQGIVEFVARFSENNERKYIHERAEFVKDNEKWLYKDGTIVPSEQYVRESPKVGRNDPCSCGSGKKHKKCCGK